MRIVKLKKKWLKNYETFYTELGLNKNNQVEPDKVHLSIQDAMIVKKMIKKEFKRHYPYLTKNKLDYAIGMYLLNLEPKVNPALKPGWVLIEE